MTFQTPSAGLWPAGNDARVIAKSYDAGWGGAGAKTIRLESAEGGQRGARSANAFKDFRRSHRLRKYRVDFRPAIDVLARRVSPGKKGLPKHMLIASIMEEYEKGRWQELTRMVQDTGCDAFELNFSCPHGMTERKMGSEMGEHRTCRASYKLGD